MFATPLGFLALLAVPAIVALHLFRRRFRPHTVSARFLWADDDATPVSGRARAPLRSSTSLVCEIAAAVALACALAGPRGCSGEDGRHWVAVVDGSASMGAVASANDGSVLDAARARIRERIAELPRGSRVTIVASGPRPRVVAGPAAFPAEAEAALGSLATSTLAHDLAPAAALGLQLSGGGAVTCFTDAYRPDTLPPEVEIVALGRRLENVAIVHATREPASGDARERDRVVLTIANLSDAPRTTRVTAATAPPEDAPVLEPRDVSLAPRERKVVAFDVARDTGTIAARLAPDALAIDDVAWLAPRPARVVRVRADLAPEILARLGLADGTGPIGRWLALAPDVVEAPDAATAHVWLSDHAGGGESTWTLRFALPRGERTEFVGPFLCDLRHPLLEGTTLEGIVWSADPAAAPPGVPLVSAGNVPLLVEERGATRRDYVMNQDPERSTFARSPDWPILLANLLEARRAELAGAARTNLLVGDTVIWRGVFAPDDTTPLRLVGPTTTREFLPRATIVLDGFDAPGPYRLERPRATLGADTLTTFGVSFADAAESDLTSLSSGTRAAAVPLASAPPRASWLVAVLALAAVLALLVDWWVLQRATRRVTAPGSAI